MFVKHQIQFHIPGAGGTGVTTTAVPGLKEF